MDTAAPPPLPAPEEEQVEDRPRLGPWGIGRKRAEEREAAEDARYSRRSFPCPACGARLHYDPGKAALTCPYCQTLAPVPEVDDQAAHVEQPYDLHLRLDSLPEEEVMAVDCAGCGANIEFHAEEHARLCPFCDAAIVGDARRQRRIVPQGVLPFGLPRQDAETRMSAWLVSRWFAPNGLSAEAKADHFNGIYVPFWTYDARTVTAYTGQRGRRVGSGKNRRTVWTSVSGTVRVPFDDVIVSGSRSVSAEFKDALAPWPLPRMETYQTEFLAGFRAENHTVGLKEGFTDAQRFMQAVIEDAIRKDIGGDRQRITSSRSEYGDVTYKHLLVPVWITHYAFEGKRFRLSVNGCTGKVYGHRPFCNWKLFAAAALAMAALFPVGWAISTVPWFG